MRVPGELRQEKQLRVLQTEIALVARLHFVAPEGGEMDGTESVYDVVEHIRPFRAAVQSHGKGVREVLAVERHFGGHLEAEVPDGLPLLELGA